MDSFTFLQQKQFKTITVESQPQEFGIGAIIELIQILPVLSGLCVYVCVYTVLSHS